MFKRVDRGVFSCCKECCSISVKNEKVKGACMLLLDVEQGGGSEEGQHMPHHLFAQRLCSN